MLAQDAAAPADPNDLPGKTLSQPDTSLTNYLKGHPGATELQHKQGQLRFRNKDGSSAAVLGPVTHQDPNTGAWVPIAPVLSQTNNGWRVDNAINNLVIRKAGTNQHILTQTFSDPATKHDSVISITLPSLTYDKGFNFHFTQDGLTWNLSLDQTAAFNLTTTVSKRLGPKTYTMPVSSSEPLNVNSGGALTGDARVILTRAVMIPRMGKRVLCSAWTYSKKDGAAFTCDDSAFKENQFPYQIDPSSQTLTDGGTYFVDKWSDGQGNGGADGATVNFNTANLVPVGATSVSTSCGFDATYYLVWEGQSVECSVGPFNNAGVTAVHVDMRDPPCGDCAGYSTADVSNISLTVTWTPPPTQTQTISTSPGGLSLTVDGSPCTSPCTFQWVVGSAHTIATAATQGDANTQYLFSYWSDGGALSHVVFPSSPSIYTAYFTTQIIKAVVTVATSPASRAVAVDGQACTAPCSYQWLPGSTHTIATTTSQSGAVGTQYLFTNWSDGGAVSHTITVPSSAATYTATFKTQYYLATAAATGGTVLPASGWYDSGTAVSISTTPNASYYFAGFLGALSGTASPQSLVMDAAKSVTAVFDLLASPVSDAVIRTGLRSTGAYWGAAGEQIDLQSGNLNYTVPLLQAKTTGGLSVTFALSYNSQIWRRSAGSSPLLLGRDTGFGLGWTLQAGSLLPGGSYYTFTDSTGAQYKLDRNNGGVWTSGTGTYVAYDSASQRLYFPDGSFWAMTVQSAPIEADAGTQYPSCIQDTNGNQIKIQYGPAAGSSTPNTSGRITQIADGRKHRMLGYSYTFSYSYPSGADLYPHLLQIGNAILSGESFTFSYGSGLTLSEPFTGTAYGLATVLQTITFPYAGSSYSLQYQLGTGELTQATTPSGGSLAWGYGAFTYSGTGLSYREVQTRQISPSAGVTYSWNITRDNNPTSHTSATVSDMQANSTKVWTFGASGASQGLATSYEERGPGGVALLHNNYTWFTDNNNVYVGGVQTTLYSGSSQVETWSTQRLDIYGNLTQSAVYEYGPAAVYPPWDARSGMSPARVYNYTYLTDARYNTGTNYASRYIRNRLLTATVTTAAGTVTLVDNWYDTPRAGFSCNMGPMVQRTQYADNTLHDDSNYDVNMVYRGNVYTRYSLGVDLTCYVYDTAGVLLTSEDPNGNTLTSAPSADTNYSLPGVLTPNYNSNLATTMTYAPSWAVTSVTGPNNVMGITTYDLAGRPASVRIPDGASTGYTYTMNPTTQTAVIGTGTPWVGTRWKRTTQDGFGRVVKVENGTGATPGTAVSQVDTQYAPCACSPLGKLWRVSMPHAPSAQPVWTTYTYDGSGRTLTVTAPDGSVTRTDYLVAYGGYTGSFVRVTDPAGKWKVQQTDAAGNLIRIFEPNPSGGADWITNYTYDPIGNLTDVSMPRPNGTQTRHFGYFGRSLALATSPENGTVYYSYDLSHRMVCRTDAKGQQTRYIYDNYGRVTQVQHWVFRLFQQTTQYILQEDIQQRVDYTYDGQNPIDSSYSENSWGRLTTVQFHDELNTTPFSYMYSYNTAGRVTKHRMDIDRGTSNSHSFEASYTWDPEGHITGMDYGQPGIDNRQQLTMTYDANGRLGGMSGGETGNPSSQFSLGAGYGVAGELTGIGYYGGGASYNETRTYNAMFQMTRLTVAGSAFGSSPGNALDMQYTYPTGANNGRITQSIDGVANETVNYTYDAVNRLSTAATTSGAWGQSFGYDGFGNLTSKTSTAGNTPSFSVTYDPLTNWQMGGSYDANGNPTNSTVDVENRLIWGADGRKYVYDPSGKRVRRMDTASEEYYFYGVGGQKLVTLTCLVDPNNAPNCNNGVHYNVYFGGKLIKSKGVVVATDRLGSVRATGNGERMSYYPYGEERTSTPDGREKFGTYTRDGPGMDYADQRYYGVGVEGS